MYNIHDNTLNIRLYESLDTFKVIGVPDMTTLYRVPLALEEHGVFKFLTVRLNLMLKPDYDRSLMIRWRDLAERYARRFH
jgi:CTP synthase